MPCPSRPPVKDQDPPTKRWVRIVGGFTTAAGAAQVSTTYKNVADQDYLDYGVAGVRYQYCHVYGVRAWACANSSAEGIQMYSITDGTTTGEGAFFEGTSAEGADVYTHVAFQVGLQERIAWIGVGNTQVICIQNITTSSAIVIGNYVLDVLMGFR